MGREWMGERRDGEGIMGEKGMGINLLHWRGKTASLSLRRRMGGTKRGGVGTLNRIQHSLLFEYSSLQITL